MGSLTNTFQGARLREPLNINAEKLFNGATTFVVTNRFGTFQHMFKGCETTRGYGPTGVPRREWKESSRLHELLLTYAQFAEPSTSDLPFEGKVYPHKWVRPEIPFTPSGFTFTGRTLLVSRRIQVMDGQYKGQIFLPRPLRAAKKTFWLLADKDDKVRQSLRTEYENYMHGSEKEEPASRKPIYAGTFLCVGCGEAEPQDDGFLLCGNCLYTAPNGNYVDEKEWSETDTSREDGDGSLAGFDFSMSENPNRKNNGFQDDPVHISRLRTVLSKNVKKCSKCQAPKDEKPLFVCLTCERVALCEACRLEHDHQVTDSWCTVETSEPSPDLKSTDHYPPLNEERSDETRPLDETELAWILAIRYPGFTQKYKGSTDELSDAYLAARRAAARLAGHYLLDKSYAEIGSIMGVKGDTVKKFCQRSRKSYFDKFVRQPMPEEVRSSSASGMLRELYPSSVSMGVQVHGNRLY